MDRPLPADLVLDLCTPRLLLLGAREVLSTARLEPVLGSEDRRLRRVAQVAFDYDQMRPSPAERAVLALATRETTLGAALSLPHPRTQVVRAVYALVAGGLLEMLEAAPAPRVVPPRAIAPAPVAPAAPADPDSTLRGVLFGADDPALPTFSPELVTPADWAAASPPAAGPSTRPMSALDRDLLTPSPPPDSEIPGYDEPAADEPAANWGAGAPGPGEEVPADPRGGRAACPGAPRERPAGAGGGDAAHPRRAPPRGRGAAGGSWRRRWRCPGDSTARSERHFLSVLEAEPRDVETRYRLATYYRRAGMAARAVLQLRLVLSADSGHAAAWRDLGELEASAGRR